MNCEMKLDLFRICDSCNKEFKITEYSASSIEITVAYHYCPHCNERNDIWVTVKKRFQEED